jgi:hypothetical protein
MFDDAVTWISAIAIIALTYTLVRFFDQSSLVKSGSKATSVLSEATADAVKFSPAPALSPAEFRLTRRSSPDFQSMITETFQQFMGHPDELIDFIIGLCEKNYDAASALFFHGRETGSINPDNCRTDLLMSLCQACIKVGSPHFIFKYLSEMEDMKLPRDRVFLSNLIRTLTSKKHFKICLSLNDSYLSLVSPSLFPESSAAEAGKVAYSCLLYASVESKEYWRALKFFRQLERTGLEPTDRDLMNVVRAIVFREDWKSIVLILSKESDSRSAKAVDVAIQALTSAGRPDIIADVVSSAESIDIVDHILTSLKRYQTGHNVLSSILSRTDLQDSSLTLLGQGINNWAIEDPLSAMKQVLSSTTLLQHKCAIFVINSLLKKISKISRTDFRSLLGDLRMSVYTAGVRPTLATYAGLFKAAPSVTDIMDVYNLFYEQQLVDNALVMDSMLMQTILTNVSNQSSPGQEGSAFANRVISDAKKIGIHPFSEKTVSILVSILLKSGSGNFQEIGALLGSVRMTDNRVFMQAIEGAVKLRNRRWASNLFDQMIKAGVSGKVGTADKVLRMCNKDAICFGQILELALLNKMPVREDTVSVLRNEPRVKAVLAKFKYLLPQ